MFNQLNRKWISGIVSAVFMLSSAGVVHAVETTSVPVQAQTLKLEQLKERFETLKSNVNELDTFYTSLAKATKTKAGWTFMVEEGPAFSGWGTFSSAASLLALVAARVIPESERLRLVKKPAAFILVGGIVLIATGLTAQGYGRYFVEMADADIEAAKKAIDVRLGQIETQKSAIALLCKDLGATITNSIISFEGVPQGLQVFGGSSLNLNDLKSSLPTIR